MAKRKVPAVGSRVLVKKGRKPLSQLSPAYKARKIAATKGVYAAYGKRKPKGKKGKAMVAKLGRKYATGMFEKIAQKAARKYGSMEKGRKVAGAIFQRMVRARRGK